MAKVLKKAAIVLGTVGLLATGFGAFAGVALATTIGTIAGVAAGIANVGAQALAKPPPARGSISQVTVATDALRPYPMGETHFAGVLRHRAGYGGTVDGVENPYLFDVIVYSGVGPVESIVPRIDFGTVPSWYTGYIATDTQLGAMPEASALTAAYGSPPGWGAGYKLSGHAAIAWNFKFDKAGKKFAAGFPLTGALIEGVKVYDPRLDSTFPGGSGAHRVDDEETWEYSANPALHAGTYAYGRYAEGVKVMGVGLPVEGIDFAAVSAWAEVCEANDWTISGVVGEPGDKWANLKDICAAGSGEPAFAGAVLSFRYDAPVVALDTVTEADVLDSQAVTFMQSYRDRLNTIIPKYRSADHNWEMVSAEAVQSATYLTEDGEERREEWPFNFVREVDQAAQLAAYKLVNSRELHPIKLHGMPRLRAYRPGDCLHLDLPRLGLDTDAVVLERKIDPATMTVELTLIGETDAKHAYALGLTGTAPPAPALGQDAEERDRTAANNALPEGLDFDFTGGTLPDGVTFERASSATYFDATGDMDLAASDEARFDYGGIVPAGEPALLIESAATNLFSHSETIDDAAWNVFIASKGTADGAAAPDGATTADAIALAASASAYVYHALSGLTNGGPYVLSGFFKRNAGSNQVHRLGHFVGAGEASADFTATAAWQRFEAPFTAGSTAGNAGVLGGSGGASADLLAWGLQWEEGAAATSYIPTTSGTATRAADVCSFEIPAGVTGLRYVFDDDSEQDVAVSSGPYTVPTDLDRPRIKRIYAI